ncbi:MAG: hypothetical protein AAF560_20170 [Acidobacteriota bacterium]
MTDQELRDIVARLAETQAKTSREVRATERFLRENGRATDRYLKELGKQLGGLGDKFGSFTEGMALPSMTRLLEKRFGLDNIAPRYRVR